MHCFEAFRCPRDDCPVRVRRLRRCWEVFAAQGIEVTQAVCPYAPCDRCHYRLGWEIGLIGDSMFGDAEDQSLAPTEVLAGIPIDSPAASPGGEPTDGGDRWQDERPSDLAVPQSEPSSTTGDSPPLPPRLPQERRAGASQAGAQAPATQRETPVSSGATEPSPESVPVQFDAEAGEGSAIPDADLVEEFTEGDSLSDAHLPGSVEVAPAAGAEAWPVVAVDDSAGMQPPSTSRRFCFELMPCPNPRCPVRTRKIFRCFQFFKKFDDAEKQRRSGCSRRCSECHYREGWEIGLIHEGLFADIVEQRQKALARSERIRTQGIVEIYLQELARKPLDRAGELALAKRLAGDRQASELLLTANLRLVVRMARQFSGRGLALLDLVQEGNLGLIQAVAKFDFTLGYRFSTYAAHWVRYYMQKAVSEQGRTIRVPHHLLVVANRIRHCIRQLTGELQRAPTLDEISRSLLLDPNRILDIIRLTEAPISIEAAAANAGDDEGAAGVIEYLLADREALTPEEQALESAKREAVNAAIDRLPDRLRAIVRQHYGFGGEPASLADIGRQLGLTRERVRQLLVQALGRLREMEFVHQLGPIND